MMPFEFLFGATQGCATVPRRQYRGEHRLVRTGSDDAFYITTDHTWQALCASYTPDISLYTSEARMFANIACREWYKKV